MSCDIEALKQVPFFGLLDDEELAVLASQVEQKTFGARQRIYKIGETSLRAYVIVSGVVRVTTIDASISRAQGSFSASLRCSRKHRIRRRPSRLRKRPALKWIAMISVCCCNASPTPDST